MVRGKGESKTDTEQLKGILEEFRPEVIQQAVAELMDKDVCKKSYKEFDDPGPEVEVGPEAAEDVARMEAIIGEDNLLPVHFLEEGSVVQRPVARIVFTSGSALGTGFLVADRWLMTNNHVIENQSMASGLRVQFNYQLDYMGNPRSLDIWKPSTNRGFYTDVPLDFTLIEMQARYTFTVAASEMIVRDPSYQPSFPPYVLKTIYPGEKWGHIQLKDSLSYAKDQHLNCIQHPQGRRKEVALQHNHVTNVYTTRIRYRTDTDYGSSGSPVFNNEWDLVALHHARGDQSAPGVWENNEGMRIDKIVVYLRNNATQEHLSQLGI